jgi:membrane-bound lytic murein transglycosylase D
MSKSKRPSFRTHRLTAVIASTMFLSACGSMHNSSENTDELITAESRANGRVITINREAARVSIPSDTTQTEIDSRDHPDIWTRIVAGSAFSLLHDNNRIQRQIDFYKENSAYLLTVTDRSSPFIFEIVEELDRRGMPLELALLPIVESAYNPNATAPGNTVGLWQILGSTGRSLGLKQDWWYDGRRDPIDSTNAALDYLSTLYERFDQDWLLALAAYNTGQGNVQKAIDRNVSLGRPTDYWSLNLPTVTEEFVPKLIALSRLVSAPEQHGVEVTLIENKPTVTRIDVGFQIDLSQAAAAAGLESEYLYQLNPGFRQWATHPDGPHTLLIPITHADTFLAALDTLEAQPVVTWDRYVVQPGDTLSKIAQEFRTQVTALQQANGLQGSRIIAGESLLIPRAYNSATPVPTPNAPVYLSSDATSGHAGVLPASPPARYEVRSGDSLWRIANRYKVSVANLAAWNEIDHDALLKPGQVLSLRADPILAASDVIRPAERETHYRVRAGDTLARIARQFGVTVADIANWNGISVEDLIHPGQQLLLVPGRTNLN